jgi:adenosylcobinamide kinase/adenosylcobinamide-phosphate guanylyltransferase
MEMIIGGAFQGKSTYAKRNYPNINWREGDSLTFEELLHAEGVLGFDKYIYKELKDGRELSTLAKSLITENPDIILVSNEVGYGVVPIDAFDRAYREMVGRICTELAAYSKKVTRIICGIGTVIKDVTED